MKARSDESLEESLHRWDSVAAVHSGRATSNLVPTSLDSTLIPQNYLVKGFCGTMGVVGHGSKRKRVCAIKAA